MSAGKMKGEQGLMALFTATPQLTPREASAARQEARTTARERHSHLYRQCLAAYHMSCAKGMLAADQRMLFGIDNPHARRLSAEHELAATAMVEAVDKFMRLPVSGRTERAEREKLLRSVKGGIAGADNAILMWRQQEPHWRAVMAGGDA